MTNIIKRSSFLPTMDSFQSSIPLTSTPKRTTKTIRSQPLSSTLSTTKSQQPSDLSLSAITLITKPKLNQKKKHRRRTHRSKPIELKHLLYSTKATRKVDVHTHYPPLKIYVV